MKRILGILITSIVALVGCNSGNEPVVFEPLYFQESAYNRNKAVFNIFITIDYPKGGVAADAINKAILQCGLFPKECVADDKVKNFPKAVKVIANYYKKEFETTDVEYVKLESDSIVYAPGASPYVYSLGSAVTYPYDSIINYQIGYSVTMDGEHFNYQIASLNFDRKTGNLIQLKDFIKPEAEGKIIDMIVAVLVKQYECASLHELQNDCLIFTKNAPYIPENFVIGRDSVEFIYNCEEVAPYSVGAFSAKLSYNELRGCLQ
ncbi:MAG: DUF3298 domain-containing protein [Bacteroidales bacterium]|nr:DUF3298 domain-containing protein [Bacteroidales bacterium]